MKLNLFKRAAETKGEVNELRVGGKIPAVMYSKGLPSTPAAVDRSEFEALMRSIRKGRLSTTKITLEGEDGKSRHAIVKEIQYHPVTYEILHLDFVELLDDQTVDLNVPIECTGVVECAGIKLGGVLRQVLRQIKVRCLPKDIPERFKLDVRNMGIRESKRLSDLEIPTNVRPLSKLQEVAVTIAKR